MGWGGREWQLKVLGWIMSFLGIFQMWVIISLPWRKWFKPEIVAHNWKLLNKNLLVCLLLIHFFKFFLNFYCWHSYRCLHYPLPPPAPFACLHTAPPPFPLRHWVQAGGEGAGLNPCDLMNSEVWEPLMNIENLILSYDIIHKIFIKTNFCSWRRILEIVYMLPPLF